jgi:hypothetical protein
MVELTAVEARKAKRKADREKWEQQLLVQLRQRGLAKFFVQEWTIPNGWKNYRWDFADPMNKVVIEVQGGLFTRGKAAHSSPMGIIRDQDKINLASFNDYAPFQCNEKTIKDQSFVSMLALFYKRLSETGKLYGGTLG